MYLFDAHIVLYFFIYSFVGWMFESALCSVMERKPVNRGFLHGPLCPVYGLGGVAILLLAAPFGKTPFLVFIISLIAVTLIEYFVGWLLETLFSMRWWDYSHCMFNLKGRICLKNSLFFGLMGLGMVYLLHPPVAEFLARFSPLSLRIAAGLMLALLAVDLTFTLNNLLDLKRRLRTLQFCVGEMVEMDKRHGWYDKQDISRSLERLRALIVEEPDPEDEVMLDLVAKLQQATSWAEQFSARWSTGRTARLMRAYPNLKIAGFDEVIHKLRERAGMRKRGPSYKERYRQWQARRREKKREEQNS